jgi:hypothetical protein
MAICLMYIFDLFYFGIQSLFYMYGIFLCEYLYDNIELQCYVDRLAQSLFYMYGTFLYAHWNIYEMYNFSMQWQIIFSNFLLFNVDVTCRYINKM